jgi:hypothetical protein
MRLIITQPAPAAHANLDAAARRRADRLAQATVGQMQDVVTGCRSFTPDQATMSASRSRWSLLAGYTGLADDRPRASPASRFSCPWSVKSKSRSGRIPEPGY